MADFVSMIKERSLWIAFFLMSAMVVGGFGYVVDGVRKAKEAARDSARNQREIEDNTKTLHRRITSLDLKVNIMESQLDRSDERTKIFWEMYMRAR